MRRSKTEFLCAALGTLYSIYLLAYFADTAAGSIGGSIATMMVTPHMLMCVLGSFFAWIAFFNNKRGMALTAAIMFCVAAVMFTMYAELCIPEIILGFIGYVRIGKILNKENGGIQS